MACTVFANMRGIAHKGSGGMSTVFPDVCKTASPGGPVPIPYPNTAKSADTTGGSSTVKIDGESAMLKGSNYCMSVGDEAGSAGGGVISSTIKGKAEFIMYSFDIQIEGKNVCRLGDPLFHNNKNIAG